MVNSARNGQASMWAATVVLVDIGEVPIPARPKTSLNGPPGNPRYGIR